MDRQAREFMLDLMEQCSQYAGELENEFGSGSSYSDWSLPVLLAQAVESTGVAMQTWQAMLDERQAERRRQEALRRIRANGAYWLTYAWEDGHRVERLWPDLTWRTEDVIGGEVALIGPINEHEAVRTLVAGHGLQLLRVLTYREKPDQSWYVVG